MVEPVMNEEEARNQRGGRRMLLLLLGVFALPVVLVTLLYQFQWRPEGGSYGVLREPPRLLALSEMQDFGAGKFGPERWKDKWSLVLVDAEGCAADCQAQLHSMRQVHVALNKEIDRVQRVLVLPRGIDAQTGAMLRQRYPDLHMLVDAGALAAQFDPSAGSLYLVDPLGNWMMSYPTGFDPKGLMKDLQRLLKYSWVG